MQTSEIEKIIQHVIKVTVHHFRKLKGALFFASSNPQIPYPPQTAIQAVF